MRDLLKYIRGMRQCLQFLDRRRGTETACGKAHEGGKGEEGEEGAGRWKKELLGHDKSFQIACCLLHQWTVFIHSVVDAKTQGQTSASCFSPSARISSKNLPSCDHSGPDIFFGFLNIKTTVKELRAQTERNAMTPPVSAVRILLQPSSLQSCDLGKSKSGRNWVDSYSMIHRLLSSQA